MVYGQLGPETIRSQDDSDPTFIRRGTEFYVKIGFKRPRPFGAVPNCHSNLALKIGPFATGVNK